MKKCISVLLLCCLICTVYAATTEDPGVRCNQAVNCFNCIQNGCKWCPRANYCYLSGSTFNQCEEDQNIPSPEMCPKSPGNYDSKLAERLAIMSSLAYLTPKSKDLGDAQDRINDLSSPQYQYKIDTFYDQGDTAVVLLTSSVEKSIIVAFRGTSALIRQFPKEGVCSFVKKLSPIGGNANRYFVNTHENLYRCFGGRLTTLLRQNPDYQVYVTGHSLGGALATLHAGFLVANNTVLESRVSLYTFGAPRVGNEEFSIRFNTLISKAWRITGYGDIVPHLPFEVFGYAHSGQEAFYPTKVIESLPPELCNLVEDHDCSNKLTYKYANSKILQYHSGYFFDSMPDVVSCPNSNEGTKFTTANGCNVYDGTQLIFRKRRNIFKSAYNCAKQKVKAFGNMIDGFVCDHRDGPANGQAGPAQWSMGALSAALLLSLFFF